MEHVSSALLELTVKGNIGDDERDARHLGP
jgi:hypothetical protein